MLLSAEQQQIRDTLRAFARDELAPHAAASNLQIGITDEFFAIRLTRVAKSRYANTKGFAMNARSFGAPAVFADLDNVRVAELKL